MSDDFDEFEEVASIVGDLGARDLPPMDERHDCALCGVRPGATPYQSLCETAWHKPTCEWRRAREWRLRHVSTVE